MSTPSTQATTATGLKAIAERVRARGIELLKDHELGELKEIWRRLPNATASPPVGQRGLAERVALCLIELEDKAPADLRKFLSEAEPLRPWPAAGSKDGIEGRDGKPGDGPSEEGKKAPAIAAAPAGAPAPSGAGGGIETTQTNEETSMQTHTSAGKGAKRGPPPAAAKAVGKAAKKASGAAPKRPAAAKKAAAERGSGPRPGSITELVVKLTKEGKGAEAIGNAVAKEHPGTSFAKEVKGGDYHAVAWYQRQARLKGWLPKAK